MVETTRFARSSVFAVLSIDRKAISRRPALRRPNSSLVPRALDLQPQTRQSTQSTTPGLRPVSVTQACLSSPVSALRSPPNINP